MRELRPSNASSSIRGAIAVNRFGLGALPGELKAVSTDPRGWLHDQIGRVGPALIRDTGLRRSVDAAKDEIDLNIRWGRILDRFPAAEAAQRAQAIIRQAQLDRKAELVKEVAARTDHAITTRSGFTERWVRFWSNHFTVSALKRSTVGLAGAFEREAIRPYIYGSFATLLEKAIFHQGMIFYLDNESSVGPSSELGQKRGAGLNENLAREILELHTVGVSGGYTLEDIKELARALTGWKISRPPLRTPEFGFGKIVFERRVHEPGERRLLGRKYPATGPDQARKMLRDLAVSRQTATHLAFKLIRHFIMDRPLDRDINVLARTFLDTDGDLSAVAHALVNLREAWRPEQRKIKTPDDLIISAARALGEDAVFATNRSRAFLIFGQYPFSAPAPDGWSDEAGFWASADGTRRRLDWAVRVAGRAEDEIEWEGFFRRTLGVQTSSFTYRQISRAESRVQALALALMSPEFQRR